MVVISSPVGLGDCTFLRYRCFRLPNLDARVLDGVIAAGDDSPTLMEKSFDKEEASFVSPLVPFVACRVRVGEPFDFTPTKSFIFVDISSLSRRLPKDLVRILIFSFLVTISSSNVASLRSFAANADFNCCRSS